LEAFLSRNDAIPPSPTKGDYQSETDAKADDIFTREDPFALFTDWLKAARDKEINDPNAMALSTADAEGFPDVRMVLLKDVDPARLCLLHQHRKPEGRPAGRKRPRSALLSLEVAAPPGAGEGDCLAGVCEEADAYFNSRARDSRIGAWASKQSRPLESRFALEKAVAGYAAKFNIGDIPRPDFWTGYRIAAVRLEFWRDRAFRLHDRLVFERDDISGPWSTTRLYP
jgi:pyridoxamine 5'-phosphate oxidase